MSEKKSEKSKTYLYAPFTGSVDQLLENMSRTDTEFVTEVDDGDETIDTETAVAYLKSEFHISDEEARKAVLEMQMEKLAPVLQSLIEEGLVEISGANEAGDPLYQLTALGKAAAEAIRITDEKKGKK